MKVLTTILALTYSLSSFAYDYSQNVNLESIKIQGVLEEKISDPNTGKIQINRDILNKNEMQKILVGATLKYHYETSTLSVSDFLNYLDPVKKTVKSVQLPTSMIKLDDNGTIYFSNDSAGSMYLENIVSVYLVLDQRKISRGTSEYNCVKDVDINNEKDIFLKCSREVILPTITYLKNFKHIISTKNGQKDSQFNACEVGLNIDFKNYYTNHPNFIGGDITLYDRNSEELKIVRVEKTAIKGSMVRFYDKNGIEFLAVFADHYTGRIDQLFTLNCGSYSLY